MTTPSTYDQIVATARRRGAAFGVLIDPDKQPVDSLDRFCNGCAAASVDFVLVGGSRVRSAVFESFVEQLRSATQLPLVGFPGSPAQLSSHLDAVLYLSLISGRNPDYLIGQQVKAAPTMHALGLESIPTGYMLIESGAVTAVEEVSGTSPMARDAHQLAAETALAAQFLGMRLIYLEAGSGARSPVPEEMISAVAAVCDVPIMVGGGLHTPDAIRRRVEAGATFIVVGNAIESRSDGEYLSELADAIHVRESK